MSILRDQQGGLVGLAWEELRRLRRALGDPVYYGLLALGALAWFLPPAQSPVSWLRLAWLALVEETFFRALLQSSLATTRWGGRRLGPLSLANLAAAAVFALFHLWGQPPFWALSTFFPGLMFGLAWDRHGSLTATAFLHYFYNLCLFYGPGIFTIN